jgi:hypothetical protein
LRRGLVVVALFCVAAAPPVEPHTFRALSIAMIEGTVTDRSDLGARGDFDKTTGLLHQSLSWEPQGGYTPEEWAHQLLQAFGAIASSNPASPPFLTDGLTWKEPVAGELGTSFAGRLGVDLVIGTVWECPSSAVRATVITTGKARKAFKAHAAALSSVTCGPSPVGMDEGSVTWTFVGAEDEWRPVEDPDHDASWTRSDGAVALGVRSMDTLDLATCTATMRLAHDSWNTTYAYDEAASAYADTAAGCAHTFAATVASGDAVRGRFEHHACASRAWMTYCVVHDPALALDAACSGVVACRE